MEALLKRRYCIDATSPALGDNLAELLRIIKPLVGTSKPKADDASISRTLPGRSAVLLGTPGAPQVAREPMGPFQAAIQIARIIQAGVISEVGIIIANRGNQTLQRVEIELVGSALQKSQRKVVDYLPSQTQAQLEFEIVPAEIGTGVLRLNIRGLDDTMVFAYSGAQSVRISNSGDETIVASRARRLRAHDSESEGVTRAKMDVRQPEAPSIDLPGDFKPLELVMDYAHSLQAELILRERPTLAIPFGFLGQRQDGTLLILEPLDGPSTLPHQEIRISARPTFVLGRSREEADFLLWFWPRNEIHDTKTLRISKKHCLLELEGESIVVRSSGAAFSTLDDQSVNPLGVRLENRGILSVAGNYFLELQHVQSQIVGPLVVSNLEEWKGPLTEIKSIGLGCVRLRPVTPHVLPQHSVWLLSEGTFGTSPSNPIVFNLQDLAEIQGRFHYFQGSFWIENSVDNGAVQLDNQTVKTGSIVPLVSGKTLKLGGQRFHPKIIA